MREYERTHPWITFVCDMRRADPSLWLLLGEAASKCRHIARAPLRPSTAKSMHRVYLAKGIAATTAIEGNSLSEEQVLDAIDGKLTVPPSLEYQKQEIENITDAFNMILSKIRAGALGGPSASLVCGYNGSVLRGLKLEEGTEAGAARGHSVTVGRSYRGAPPEDCGYLLERLCEWLNGPGFVPPASYPDGSGMAFALLKAILAHLYLAWIHPFGDGNGRTARLLELHILLSAGVPSPAAHLLCNHYNQTRQEYYRQLDAASKSGGDALPFVHYAVAGFVEGLHRQLEEIWQQQWDIVWENYINDHFEGAGSASMARRRKLALALGREKGWVERRDVPSLSAALLREYIERHAKALKRDIEYLLGEGMIVQESGRVRANREAMVAFLPQGPDRPPAPDA
jgi:Fic family protein